VTILGRLDNVGENPKHVQCRVLAAVPARVIRKKGNIVVVLTLFLTYPEVLGQFPLLYLHIRSPLPSCHLRDLTSNKPELFQDSDDIDRRALEL